MAHDESGAETEAEQQIAFYIESISNNRDFLRFPILAFCLAAAFFFAAALASAARSQPPTMTGELILGAACALGCLVLRSVHITTRRRADAEIAKANEQLARLRAEARR